MINGIINVYKETGYTSHDVVAKLRGILKQKKIGHTGTLDPDAEGVLPVCLGNATKLCDMFTDKTKTYRCSLMLGIETDTEDIGGNVIKKADEEVLSSLNEEQVKAAVKSFEGKYMQIPPMYSAIKVDGVKLYDLARQGITIERKPREITIYSINIMDIRLPEVVMEITCSKGTYIRSLCRDIGEKLGCGGCMKKLLRTASGHFTLENALRLEEIQKLAETGEISHKVISTENALKTFDSIKTKPEADKLLVNGNPLPAIAVEIINDKEGENIFKGSAENDLLFRAYDSKGTFLGLYGKDMEKEIFRNEKMFL